MAEILPLRPISFNLPPDHTRLNSMAVEEDEELRNNLGAEALLIHGSSEDRFKM